MSTPPEDLEVGRRFVEQAEEALAGGDTTAALKALSLAAEAAPTNEELPLMAALLHLRSAEPAAAAHLALRSLGIRPFYPEAANLLGVAALEAGKAGLAERVLRRAAALAPGLASVRQNLRNARRAAASKRGSVARSTEATATAGIDAGGTLPVAEIDAWARDVQPRLTACIRLRSGDTERLSACLDSLRDVVDEIVVVDERSPVEDGRPLDPQNDIDRVVRAEGPGSGPINEGLRHARGIWILILDATETLDRSGLRELQRALRAPRALASAVTIAEPGNRPLHRELRLVRNAPGVRFVGRWAERLLPALLPLEERWGLGIGSCSARLERAPSLRRGPSVTTRREWLRQDVADEPQDATARLALARVELEAGQLESALRLAREARKLIELESRRQRELEMEEACVVEGAALMRLGRWDELAATMRAHHDRFEPSATTRLLEGLAAKSRKDPRRAVEALRAGVALRQAAGFAAGLTELRATSWHDLLGAACMDLGDLDGAARAFEGALAIDPDDLEAQLGKIGVNHAAGQVEEVLAELDRLVQRRGDNVDVWLAGAIVLGEMPRLAAVATGWLEEAHRRFPDHTEVRRRLGEAQLRSGQAEQALQTWGGLGQESPQLAAGRLAAALAAGRELPPLPEHRTETVGRELLHWFHHWAACGAIEALDRALIDIARAEHRLPGVGHLTAEWLESIGQAEAAHNLRARLTL